MIEAPGYMGRWLSSVKPGKKDVEIILTPARTTRLIVEDAANRDEFDLRVWIDGKPRDGVRLGVSREHVRRMKDRENDAVFEIDLVDANYHVNAEWKNGAIQKRNVPLIRFDAMDAEEENRISGIDVLGKYNPAVSCAVKLRVIPPKGEPMPKGMIEIRPNDSTQNSTEISIASDGTASAKIMMPPGTPLKVLSDDFNGYSFWAYIQPVDGTNYIADCYLRPAGAIAIECVDEGGISVENYISVKTWSRNSTGGEFWHDNIYPDQSTCMREPLALLVEEHKFYVAALRPHGQTDLYYESDWITLTEDEPVKTLRCVLKSREDAR